MFLKYSQAQKRIKTAGSGKPRATGKFRVPKIVTRKNMMNIVDHGSSVLEESRMMKQTAAMMNVVPRMHRKVARNIASKRLNSTHHRVPTASKRQELRPNTVIPFDPCENSNDSGLGFDQHIDYPAPAQPVLRFAEQGACWSEGLRNLKRRRIDIKLESDDANDNFSFPRNVRQRTPTSPGAASRLPTTSTTFASPSSSFSSSSLPTSSPPTALFSSISRDGKVELQIVCQPEQQHRARYQTEGSRGAVKDRSGGGFPVVKLVGYDKPATIQVFIGADQGRLVPHMFYQACQVSGKNSTPCVEKKVDGTVVIEIEALPEKDMTVTCDCVGILKERNVDVEHRFPEESPGRTKKKSTRCRMVFSTTITLNDGSKETLQVFSLPIVCTQPPGIPEIGKKSLIGCLASGGLELFILGKNFLKDTKVVFQEGEGEDRWEAIVQPDREYLQQSRLVCLVPAYKNEDIQNPVTVQLLVTSGGKSSESHDFTYLPRNSTHVGYHEIFPIPTTPPRLNMPANSCDDSLRSSQNLPQNRNSQVLPVMLWQSPSNSSKASILTATPDEIAATRPPPPPPFIPLAAMRRSSVQMIVPEPLPCEELQQEAESPCSSPETKSPSDAVVDLSTTQSPSISTLREFVCGTRSLPSISVENYLTGIESSIEGNSVPPFVQKDLAKEQQMISCPTTHSSTCQLYSPSVMHNCSPVTNIIHPQIVSDIPEQTQPAQLHSSSIISSHTTVSNMIQSSIMDDISTQSAASQLCSSPIMTSCSSVPSSVKKVRYNDDLLPNVPVTVENTVTPLVSTLLIESGNAMPFTQPLERAESTTASQCIGEILNSGNPSTVLQQQSSSSMINESQNLRVQMSELISSSMVQQSSTEKLDAFVNSAADIHMSPGQNSLSPPPPSTTEVHNLISQTSHISPLLQGVQTSCSNTTIPSTSLCSLLTGPPISSIEQPAQTTVEQNILPTAISNSSTISDMLVHQSISSNIQAGSVNMQSDLPASSQYPDRTDYSTQEDIQASLMSEIEKPKVKDEFMLMEMLSTACAVPSSNSQPVSSATLTTVVSTSAVPGSVRKTEEGISLGSGIQELTQMSDHDLISYINPSCFDQVE